MTSPQWEFGWSPQMHRYYYMDKVTGRSSWSKPHGCDLPLPNKPPPQQEDTVAPPMPTDLPAGWLAALDTRPEVNRYYYYRKDRPQDRTWYKPLPSQEVEPVPEAPRVQRSQSGNVGLRPEQFMRCYQIFKKELQHVKAERSEPTKRKLIGEIIQEVWKANQEVLASSDHISVPVSRKVRFEEVQEALSKRLVHSFDRPPKVTFAETNLASAALLFKQQDRSRHVCIINCSSGEPAKAKGLNTETLLYCQTPNLLPSLALTTPTTLCPFGPVACERDDRSKFSDVIYSPDCALARAGISEDFDVLPEGRQVTAPVLSAAAPIKEPYEVDLTRKHDIQADERNVQDTLTSIFVTPVLRNASCTTLVLGAWGCEERFSTDPTFVATKLAEILSGKPVQDVRIGWLYNEVHFCFPQRIAGISDSKSGDKDADIEVFRRVFDQYKINHREL